MRKTPSIAEIAHRNTASGGHYFDKDTLRFFGQRRSDFRSKRLKDGRVVVYAFTHGGWSIDFGGKPSSLAVYDEATGQVSTPADAEELKELLRK